MDVITGKKTKKQSRYFVFTWNNPDMNPDDALLCFKSWKDIRYIIFQLEIGKTTNTTHYQGYIEFNSPQRESTLCNRYKMYIRTRKGSLVQAVTYVKKQETAVEGTLREWGKPVKQGQRNDLYAFMEKIRDGERITDLFEQFPKEMALYPRFYRQVKSVFFKQYLNQDKRVILCIGEPRTGKTTWARKLNEDYWINPIATQNWFDGYEQQEVAILDDYGLDGTVYKLVDLLRLTHKWTETVPVKGGFTQWNPSVVIITTNYHPLQWYRLNPEPENRRIDRWISYKALYKRFTKVLLFGIEDEPMVCDDIGAFFLDIDNLFEHQAVPFTVREEFLIDRLKTVEKLEPSELPPNISFESHSDSETTEETQSDENNYTYKSVSEEECFRQTDFLEGIFYDDQKHSLEEDISVDLEKEIANIDVAQMSIDQFIARHKCNSIYNKCN